MTRKDYIELASAIRSTRMDSRYWHPAALDALRAVEDEITSRLKADNPRFDVERFHVASDRDPS